MVMQFSFPVLFSICWYHSFIPICSTVTSLFWKKDTYGNTFILLRFPHSTRTLPFIRCCSVRWCRSFDIRLPTPHYHRLRWYVTVTTFTYGVSTFRPTTFHGVVLEPFTFDVVPVTFYRYSSVLWADSCWWWRYNLLIPIYVPIPHHFRWYSMGIYVTFVHSTILHCSFHPFYRYVCWWRPHHSDIHSIRYHHVHSHSPVVDVLPMHSVRCDVCSFSTFCYSVRYPPRPLLLPFTAFLHFLHSTTPFYHLFYRYGDVTMHCITWCSDCWWYDTVR